ncbi:MAG: hypothetical protein ACAH80_07805 [Alphaproteobacteria bacterium]
MSRNLCCLLFSLLLLCASPVMAEENERDSFYLSLVDASRKDVKEARWCKIRDLYYNTSFYKTANGSAKKAMGPVAKRLMSERSSEAVAAYESFMREHGGSLAAHMYAIDMYLWNKQNMKAKKESVLPDLGKGIHYIRIMDEEETAKALATCAARGGDGKSMETAYRVADHDEAEALLQQISGLHADGTESMDAADKKYEILTVNIPDGPTQKVWFTLQTPQVQ